MKEALCANGPEDLPNRLMYMPAGNDDCNVIVPAVMGDRPIPAPDMIAMCAGIARESFGPPFLIAWCSEAYMQAWLDPNSPDIPTMRGQLTERYRRGDPNVSEGLTMTAVHRREDNSFRVVSVSQSFHYADGSVVFGKEEWVDSLNVDEYSKGPVVQELINAFGSEQN